MGESMSHRMTEYDRTQLAAIHSWTSPELGWFGQVMKVVNWPLDKAGQLVFDVPEIGPLLEKAFAGVVGLLNDGASWSVRPKAIFADFHKHGYEAVHSLDDIHSLRLRDVDATIGFLAAKYKTTALAEGAATGLLGLPGIPADVVAILSLNLRAIGEYATYCGFDISLQQERLFAMNVLGLASSPSDAAKQAAMAQLAKIAKAVAQKKTWKTLEEHAFVSIIRKVAEALGVRLTKAKLAQVVPVAGAVVGGGFNAYYTSRVCDAAYFLYRERFLAEKYGEDVIKDAGKPAEGFEPDYSSE